MKEKLLKLLGERGKIYLIELPSLMPEINGEYSIYMSVKEGLNPNILWLGGVTQDFIKLFNELLIEERSIEWNPENIFVLMFDGMPIYKNIALGDPKMIKTKEECWLPISIALAGKKKND